MDNTAAPRLQDTISFTSSIFCKYTHDRADARARGRLEEDEDGDEDYRRSAGTVMAHEFERVEEENKEALLEDERAGRERACVGAAAGGGGGPGPLPPRGALGNDSAFDHECDDDDDAHEGEGEQDAAQGETQQELVEQERRRAEDLDVGRPRAPEPSLFGMGIGLGMGMRERRSTGSPLSASTSGAEAKAVPVQAASTSLTTTASAPTCVTTEDVHAQVERLAAQDRRLASWPCAWARGRHCAAGTHPRQLTSTRFCLHYVRVAQALLGG